jgi:hypothetical protein
MAKPIAICATMLVFIAGHSPTLAGERGLKSDCAARMQQLDASNAEGQERLDEKNAVIEACARQYARDKTIGDLVKACAKYEEQPVVKQQAVADCQLAAFNYAEALRSLEADYGK